MKIDALRPLVDAQQLNINSKRYERVHDAFTKTELDSDEVQRLERLYQSLLAAEDLGSFAPYWERVDLKQIRKDVERLGSGVVEKSVRAEKAIHDLRGGSFFVLTTLSAEETESFFQFQEFRSFAMEQAKLMRGMFNFLDQERTRVEEETIQVHTVAKLLESWQNRLLVRAGKQVRVQALNHFEGAVTCRCVETSAFDRVLVNLTNNAARFAPEQTPVRVVAFQVSDLLCRVCVLNDIESDQKKWLREKLENNGLHLFQVGVTRGSTGLGLGSTADILAQVFGVFETEKLVRSGYVGTAMVQERFCAWFHWPLYLPRDGDSLCRCT